MLGVMKKARAASAPKVKEPPPAAAFEFLMFLARAEETVRSAVAADIDAEFGGDEAAEEEIWRAKIRSYETELSRRLECWHGLGVQAIERYRSRIEELRPALDAALEARRRAASAAAAASVVPVLPDLCAVPPLITSVNGSGAIADGGTDRSLVGGAVSSSGLLDETSVPDACSARPEAVSPSFSAELPKTENAAALPWRKSGAKRPLAAGASHAMKSGIEDEMMDLSEGMKGAANTFLQTLKKDNARLEEISSAQQTNLDNVKAQTQKGKDMMKSDQLGFFCTMIMLMISVVIFFLMIPFIIIT